MQVHVELGRTYVVVRPVGSFYGGDETVELERKLGAAVDRGNAIVVIDLSRTRDLNSTAIGIIVGAYRRATARGAELRLACVEADLQNVLAVLKLVNVIPVYDAVQKALTDPAPPANASAPQNFAA